MAANGNDFQDRRSAPAVARNRDVILQVLRSVLPSSGLVLEVASGTGEHAVHFARAFPALDWQPSDPSADARRSIAGWIAADTLPNIRAPLDLDAECGLAAMDRADAILCINMLHISPWSATEGLMQGARRLLAPGAPLCLYGPFKRSTHELEPSNRAFDADLRQRDPRWGLRELDAVTACAATHRLALDRVVEMPANNLMPIFRAQPIGDAA
jgi:SAM-dependent methyltransferase